MKFSDIPGKVRYFLRRTLFDCYKGFTNCISGTSYMLRHWPWRSPSGEPPGPMMIFMVDGNFYSGGMADRFKGLVSAYAWSKQRDIPFRIRYVAPFELGDYLAPASYDWRLREGEYRENIRDAELMYARAEHGRRLYRKRIGNRQLHFYGNYDNLEYFNLKGGTSYLWGELFRELFRPGQRLEEALCRCRTDIGAPYVAAVFRFQNLLGDFSEYSFVPLEDMDAREAIVNECVAGLKELQRRHPDIPVLVTSDSSTFLGRVSEIPGIYIIAGKVVHMGTVSGESYETYLKSFIDFYMLSESMKVYSLGTREMYPTSFPVYAAKVNDVPFERILLEAGQWIVRK